LIVMRASSVFRLRVGVVAAVALGVASGGWAVARPASAQAPTTTLPPTTSPTSTAPAGEAAPVPVSWSVHPAPADGGEVRPNFVLEGAAGATVSDALVVENTSDVNLVLGVYASDAFNTPSGGTDLLAGDSDAVDLGSWTTPDQSSITVPPGGSVTVPFTIEIPDDAEPGDHTGGIVTSLRLSEPNGAGNQVNVERRLGSRIYLRVEGGVEPQLTFSELEVVHGGGLNPFAPGWVEATYRVENTGNVRLRATRVVRVDPGIGATIVDEASDMAELLPGNSYEFTQRVQGVWPALGTTVEVELEPYASAGDTIEPQPAAAIARTELTIWPISQLVVVVVVLLAVALWRWRRRARRPARPAPTPPPLPTIDLTPTPGVLVGPPPNDSLPTTEK
jgi:hypothetical protein